MKKKDRMDDKKTADLLQKLQAAVLSTPKKERRDVPDQDELDFQKKIAGLLHRVSEEPKADKPKKEKKKKAELPTVEPDAEPIAEEPIEELPASPAAEQPEMPAEKAAKKAKKAERSGKKVKKESRPTADEPMPAVAEEAAEKEPQGEILQAPAPLTEDPAEDPEFAEPLEVAEPKEVTEEAASEEVPDTPAEEPLPSAIPPSIRFLTNDTPEPVKRSASVEPQTVPATEPTVHDEEPQEATSEKHLPPALRALTEEPASDIAPAEASEPKDISPEPLQERTVPNAAEPSQKRPRAPMQATPMPLPAKPADRSAPPKRSASLRKPEKAPLQSMQPKMTAEKPIDRSVQAPKADKPTPPKEGTTAGAPTAEKPIRKPIGTPTILHARVMPQAAAAHAPEQRTAVPIPPAEPAAQPMIQRETMQQKKNTPDISPAADRQAGRKPDPIVIQPSATPPPSEPIVIKPRRTAKAPEPIKTEAPAVENVREEIKPSPASSLDRSVIGASLPRQASRPSTAPTEQPPAAPPAPARPTERPAPAKKRPTAGISLPRRANAAEAASGEEPARRQAKPASEKRPTGLGGVSKPRPPRRPTHINRTPIATLPEDENLDEALDEVIADEVDLEILPVEEPEVMQTAEKRGSFFRRKEKKQSDEETLHQAVTMIEKKTGMTEDDIAMLFELGYENELGRLVGYETLKKLKYEHIRKREKPDNKQYRTAFGYRNAEYTGNQPRDGILAAYIHDRSFLILRLILTALFTLLLVPLDLPELFGELLVPYKNAYPYVFSLSGLLLLALSALLSYRQLWAGACSLFRFTPTPYSLNAVFVPLAFLGGALGLIFPGELSLPANLSASAAILLSVICDVLRLSDEMRAFRLLSSEGEKTVLESAEPRKKKLRLGDKIVKIINDDVDENLYRVRRTEQVSGFFRRCNDHSAVSRPFAVLISLMPILAFFGALLGAVASDSFGGAVSGALLTLLFTAPTSALFLYFYPLTQINRSLSYRNCVLLGDGSVEEYSQPKTVIFRDSDMYTAQKCTQIAVRDGEDFRSDLRLAGILFRKMSGTLGSVGQTAPKNTVDPPVAFVRMTENGTEALVDRHHLLAGDAAFLTKSGIRVPRESADRALRRSENASLMYVAIDGTLKLSYEIEYTVARSFEEMVWLLAEADTMTAIQSFDPNLNEAFLQTGRAKNAEYVRVIKPGRYEPETVREVADSGAIALGSTFDVARPVIAAAGIRRLQHLGYRLTLAASLLGGVAAALVILFGKELMPGIPALLPTLYRGVLCLAAWIGSHIKLKKDASLAELSANQGELRK